jgi:adenylyltransferase/sulfurtransferase
MKLSKEEFIKYKRQIIIPEIGVDGQEKLKNAKVLVVGAGGLGCPVIIYLSSIGIGHLGVIDFDFVDISNIHRQILYTYEDIDKPKCLVIEEKIKKVNPNINIYPYFIRLNKENALSIINNYDIVVDCSDNFPTKFLINDACVILNKPFVFGAVERFEGHISVFNYKNGPTYRCFLNEEPDPFEVPTCSEAGILGVVPGIIGTMQAMEVVKIIINKGEILSGKIMVVNFLNNEYYFFEIQRNENVANVTELKDYYETCNYDDTGLKKISIEELYKKINSNQDIQLIDVRDEYEIDIKLPNSENIPLYKLQESYTKIDNNKEVIFYCNYGIKSVIAVKYLEKKFNFKNLYVLSDGISKVKLSLLS